jgi:hypothetical protein
MPLSLTYCLGQHINSVDDRRHTGYIASLERLWCETEDEDPEFDPLGCRYDWTR